jgi:O-antigen/teichoic acid export membrane protein
MADRVITLGAGPARTRLACVPTSVEGRLKRGILWTGLGGAVAQGGSFVTAMIVARLLGKESYGAFALVLNTSIAMTTVASLGLGVTATKYVSEYRSAAPLRVGRILGLASAVAIVTATLFAIGLTLCAPLLAIGGEQGRLVVWGLRWSAIYVFFVTVNGYQLGALAGMEEFRTIASVNVSYGLANLLLGGLLAWRFGFRGAVLGQGCAAFLMWARYQAALRAHCKQRRFAIDYRGAWSEHAVLVDFSIPSAACGMVATIATWWCSTRLVASSGYAELAVFAAANGLRSMVLFAPGLIGRVTMPLLNQLHASRDLRAYRRTFWGAVGLNGAIALTLAAGLAVCGGRIVTLFGKGFIAPPPLLLLLMASVVLEVVATALFQSLFAAGRIWRNLGIVSIWATVLFLCVRLTTGRYGASGLAFSYLCAWAVSLTLYAVTAVRQCRPGRDLALP